jgi:RimJ/RimL family protein N-acetyltransferase
VTPHFAPGPITLENEHARLAPLALDHLAALFSAGRDEDLWRFATGAPWKREQDARAWIEQALGEQAAGRQTPFAIFDRAAGRVVGSTRYLDIQPQHRGLEIGHTWLAPAAQRTAVNTSCKLLLMAHVFETLGALRVCFKTDLRNERSQRALARSGATREGVLRCHMILWDGHVRDSVYFSVIRAEWPRVKAGLQARLARHTSRPAPSGPSPRG